MFNVQVTKILYIYIQRMELHFRFWLQLPLLFMYNAGKLVLFIVICQMAVQ